MVSSLCSLTLHKSKLCVDTFVRRSTVDFKRNVQYWWETCGFCSFDDHQCVTPILIPLSCTLLLININVGNTGKTLTMDVFRISKPTRNLAMLKSTNTTLNKLRRLTNYYYYQLFFIFLYNSFILDLACCRHVDVSFGLTNLRVVTVLRTVHFQ